MLRSACTRVHAPARVCARTHTHMRVERAIAAAAAAGALGRPTAATSINHTLSTGWLHARHVSSAAAQDAMTATGTHTHLQTPSHTHTDAAAHSSSDVHTEARISRHARADVAAADAVSARDAEFSSAIRALKREFPSIFPRGSADAHTHAHTHTHTQTHTHSSASHASTPALADMRVGVIQAVLGDAAASASRAGHRAVTAALRWLQVEHVCTHTHTGAALLTLQHPGMDASVHALAIDVLRRSHDGMAQLLSLTPEQMEALAPQAALAYVLATTRATSSAHTHVCAVARARIGRALLESRGMPLPVTLRQLRELYDLEIAPVLSGAGVARGRSGASQSSRMLEAVSEYQRSHINTVARTASPAPETLALVLCATIAAAVPASSLHLTAESSGSVDAAALAALALARTLWKSLSATQKDALNVAIPGMLVISASAQDDVAAARGWMRECVKIALAQLQRPGADSVAIHSNVGHAFRALAFATCRRQNDGAAREIFADIVDFAKAAAAMPTSSLSADRILGTAPVVDALAASLRAHCHSADGLARAFQKHPGSPLRNSSHLVVPEADVVLLGGTRLQDAKRRQSARAAANAQLPAPSSFSSPLLGDGGKAPSTSSEISTSVVDNSPEEGLANFERTRVSAWLECVHSIMEIPQPPRSALSHVYDVALTLAVRSASPLALTDIVKHMSDRSLECTSAGLAAVVSSRARADAHARATRRRGTTGGSALLRDELDDADTLPDDSAVPINAIYAPDIRYAGWDAAIDILQRFAAMAHGSALNDSSVAPDGAALILPPLLPMSTPQWGMVLHTLSKLCSNPWLVPGIYPKLPARATSLDAVLEPLFPAVHAASVPLDEPASISHVAQPELQQRATTFARAGVPFSVVQRSVVAQSLPLLSANAFAGQLGGAFTAFESIQTSCGVVANAYEDLRADTGDGPQLGPEHHIPPARAFEALVRACVLNRQPRRASKVVDLLLEAGVPPSPSTIVTLLSGLVGESDSSVADRQRHIDAALVWLDYARRSNIELPPSAVASVMGALCDARRPTDALRLLRTEQAQGRFGYVDGTAATGVFNVSGLPRSMVSALLFDGLRALRRAVRAGAVPPPRDLRVYHAPADRLHIRGVLQTMTPPIEARTWGIGHTHRHLLVPPEALIAFLSTPDTADIEDDAQAAPRSRMKQKLGALEHSKAAREKLRTQYLRFSSVPVAEEQAAAGADAAMSRDTQTEQTSMPAAGEDAEYDAWHLAWQHRRARKIQASVARSAQRAGSAPSSAAAHRTAAGGGIRSGAADAVAPPPAAAPGRLSALADLFSDVATQRPASPA